MRYSRLSLYSLMFEVHDMGLHAEMFHLILDAVGRDGLCCSQIQSV